jgi:maleylpyruvate isomerase
VATAPLGHRDTAATPSPPSGEISFGFDGRCRSARAKGINGYVDPVSTDPLVLLTEVDRATTRLVEATTDGDPTAPSLLPGWSRGHVLTHLARNADGLVNLLTWARTGVVTPQYASREARAADIEAGAGRSWPELVADVRDSAARFLDAADALDARAWAALLDLPNGPSPVALVPWRRLREVEVHHVDLGTGYTPAHWPESFAHRVLHELATTLDDISLTVRPTGLGHPVPVGGGGPPEVSGPAYALAAWLSGRSPGTGLTVEPAGPLPTVPEWA